MPEKVVSIPTLNDSNRDFECLFEVWSQAKDVQSKINFNFSQCNFLRPNAVAFIGGLARQIQSRGNIIVFDWDSFTNEKVLNNLKKNRFTAAFSNPVASWTGNSIPYREDGVQDENSIMDYLTDEWIGRGWIKVSNKLKNAVVGRMWELYCNAFEHAESEIGVFSCGQYFPNENQLILTVVDFGRGIVKNVRNYLKEDPRAEQLTAAQCLKWAFGPGNTTRPKKIARGIGLDILKEFIKVNHGRLEVYSNDGYASIDQSNESFQNRKSYFEGTIFHITLICDEKRYKFADEL